MTQDEATFWLKRFCDMPDDLHRACKYGHYECSTTPGGECLDEVLIVSRAFEPPSSPAGDFAPLLPEQRRAAAKARLEMAEHSIQRVERGLATTRDAKILRTILWLPRD